MNEGRWREGAHLALRLAAAAIAWTGSLAAAGSAGAAGELLDPLQREALQTPRANAAVLLGVTQAGSRLVAVGERGIVLLSDDAGSTWRQTAVPTSVTLTAVSFVTPSLGWAIGHSGVVLSTSDGGATWKRVLDGASAAKLTLEAAQALGAEGAASTAVRSAERLVADGTDKPFLAMHFFDARRGIVVGAFGLILATEDGGRTWRSWRERVDNPKGLHFNAVAAKGNTILIAGEQGLLLRSTDGGQSFERLQSPYTGSWFAAVVLPDDGIVIAGLRGHAFRSDDMGATFQRIEVAQPVTLTSLCRLRDGRLIALNQAGQVLIDRDGGARFDVQALPPGAPLTQVVELADGRWLASSLRGTRLLPSAPSARTSS